MLQTIAQLKTRYEEALFENFRLTSGCIDYLCGIETDYGLYAFDPTLRYDNDDDFSEFRANYPTIATMQLHCMKVQFDNMPEIDSMQKLVEFFATSLHSNDVIITETVSQYPDEQFVVTGAVVSRAYKTPAIGYNNSCDSFCKYVYNTNAGAEFGAGIVQKVTFEFVRVLLVTHLELRMTMDPILINQMMQDDIVAYRSVARK